MYHCKFVAIASGKQQSDFTTNFFIFLFQHNKDFTQPHSIVLPAFLFLMTSDIFFALYFQSQMQWYVCRWGSSLGPQPVLVHVIRPYMEWHLSWLRGPCLGAGSWAAAGLDCQTFEVRLDKKEWRVVGVLSNRPLCLKSPTNSLRGWSMWQSFFP